MGWTCEITSSMDIIMCKRLVAFLFFFGFYPVHCPCFIQLTLPATARESIRRRTGI